jgi:hypothetical protein
MINGSIVDFSGSKRPTREEVAAQDRRDREERIIRLREVLAKNEKMRTEDDRKVVAEALYKLLKRIGIRGETALLAANIGREHDSSKHLSHYAIPSGLSPEEIKRRRLNVKPEKYARIAEAAARLADLGEGDVLLQVFGQASFWRGVEREAAPEFVELASRLRFIADGISTKYDLDSFFREVERAGVSPSPTRECVQQDAQKQNWHLIGQQIGIEYSPLNTPGEIASIDSWLGWPIELNQFTWLCVSEEAGLYLPAYPSLILAAWKLGDPFPILIRNRSEANEAVSAQGWPAVVLRFCIAPIGNERLATPVLRVDLRAHIEVKSEPYYITQWANYTRWQLLRLGKDTVANYEMQIERLPKLTPPFASRDIERHSSVHNNVHNPDTLFLPIKATVCETWLSFPISQNLYDVGAWPLCDRALGFSLCETFGETAFSSFGGDTLAGLLDVALCDPTAGLDMLLEQQVKRLKDAFEASRTAKCDLRDKNWEIVKKRWERHESP